jgi:beta-lactamase superfamily II metal-dependent hydrolase
MFKVCAFRAEYGDCLLVTYGSEEERYHILVDGGFASTWDLLLAHLKKQKGDRNRLRLEAVVMTHIDLDHISGIIKLYKEKPAWLEIGDIWFNGRKELSADGLGPSQGDTLASLLPKEYNKPFEGKSVRSDRRDEPVDLDGGMQAWVLSPNYERLAALARTWPESAAVPPDAAATAKPKDTLGAGDNWPPVFTELKKVKFEEDTAPANGSSIALMLRYNGKTALLAGDSFPSVVTAGIHRIFPDRPVNVDLLKVSHHGSSGNTSSALLQAISCKRFLISTNGKKFFHPDFATIACLLEHTKGTAQMIFNYAVDDMIRWKAQPTGWPGYETLYPKDGERFVEIDLDALSRPPEPAVSPAQPHG